MRHRRYQLDMPHSSAANFRARDLDAALFALPALISHLFIFAADALIISYWAENFSAKKSVALRLKRTVIDGFGLFDLAVAPSFNLLGTSKPDCKRVEIVNSSVLFYFYSF